MTDFDHRQTAHCESGAVAGLLRHNGLTLSEPMVFGLSSALTFARIPLVKIGGMPMLAYRMPPGRIIRGLGRRLGIRFRFQRFNSAERGMAALDAHLAAGRPVGLQTSVFWLPYVPENMRFHFNGHNVIAYGRAGSDYLLSDPTFEAPAVADADSLRKARFVRGMLAPKGCLYFPESIPATIDLRGAIRRALSNTSHMMLKTPLPFIGVRGIRHVAGTLSRFDGTDDEYGRLFIGHMVRMQEEIGTGGGGFRFLFASFLQESAEQLDNPGLGEVADLFAEVGDEWRRFALFAAKMLKGRMALDYRRLAAQLRQVSDLEEGGYRQLQAALRHQALARG